MLSVAGVPLQLISVGAALSGVCADSSHVCVTALEPEHMFTNAAEKKVVNAIHLLEVSQPALPA